MSEQYIYTFRQLQVIYRNHFEDFIWKTCPSPIDRDFAHVLWKFFLDPELSAPHLEWEARVRMPCGTALNKATEQIWRSAAFQRYFLENFGYMKLRKNIHPEHWVPEIGEMCSHLVGLEECGVL